MIKIQFQPKLPKRLSPQLLVIMVAVVVTALLLLLLPLVIKQQLAFMQTNKTLHSLAVQVQEASQGKGLSEAPQPILEMLHAMADEQALLSKQFVKGDTRQADSLTYTRYSGDFVGSYQQIGRFVHALEQSGFYAQVDQLAVAPTDALGSLKASLQMTVVDPSYQAKTANALRWGVDPFTPFPDLAPVKQVAKPKPKPRPKPKPKPKPVVKPKPAPAPKKVVPAKPVKPAITGEKLPMTISLQGIWQYGEQSRALIGTETVREGDVVDGFTIVRIEKKRVLVRDAHGHEHVLRLSEF